VENIVVVRVGGSVLISVGRLLGKGGTGGTPEAEFGPATPPPNIKLVLAPVLLSDERWLRRFPDDLIDIE